LTKRKAEENIVAVTGRAGDASSGFVREPEGHVFELSFVIYDALNATTRIAGVSFTPRSRYPYSQILIFQPYGSPEACPFSVTANGRLVAFGGFAYPNTIEYRNIEARRS
jgi:hypothetical protein